MVLAASIRLWGDSSVSAGPDLVKKLRLCVKDVQD